MTIAITFFIVYVLYLLAEKRLNERRLRSFVAVVHVSGIRGKTSVCRLLDSILREKYRVYTKTTGSQPRAIDVTGREQPVRRLGPANIREQMRTIRKAHRQGAQILVLECMAVRPELVEASQQLMVKAGICVITNVRYDHSAELGDTLEEIARGLCPVVPQKGALYTAEEAMLPVLAKECEKKRARLVCCSGGSPDQSNRAVAAAIAKDLGLSLTQIEAGFQKVQTDFGDTALYHLTNNEGRPISFLNLFSVNDPQSTIERMRQFAPEDTRVVFLFNNRWDRPDRAALFAQHFFPHYPGSHVLLLGDSRPLVRRLFSQTPSLTFAAAKNWQSCLTVPEGTLVVGIGSIKGKAYTMLTALEKGVTT